MTFIPLTVLLFIVIYVMGGPEQFINTVAHWTTDLVTWVASWVKQL